MLCRGVLVLFGIHREGFGIGIGIQGWWWWEGRKEGGRSSSWLLVRRGGSGRGFLLGGRGVRFFLFALAFGYLGMVDR